MESALPSQNQSSMSPGFGPEQRDNPESKSERSSRKIMKTSLIILGVLLVLSGTYVVISSYKPEKKISESSSRESNESVQAFSIGASFAPYNLETTSFKASIPDQVIKHTELTNISNFEEAQKEKFTNSQKQALDNENFFITENKDDFYGNDPNMETGRSDDWTYLYGRIGGGSIYDREPENSVFITSDFLLHVYHRLLEREFEYVEQKEFYPRLKTMTDTIFQQALVNYKNETDAKNKESYERIIAFFSVPKAILDSAYSEFSSTEISDTKADTKENILANLTNLEEEMPSASYKNAVDEVELVMAQKDITKSPIFGSLQTEEELISPNDYTQYGPRSHYNKNSVLRTYFRAMMWYGRTSFDLKNTELTRDALHITLLMSQTDQFKNWEEIYLPTTFFVGKSDDLGIYEYGKVIKDLNIKSMDEQTISRAKEELGKLEGPQIMSSVFVGNKVFDLTKEELQEKTKGFRFMGQRFTPDAFIFTTLTQGDEKPDPETGESLPSSTTALMVMESIGNKTAEPLADRWIEENASDSKNVLANRLTALKTQFDETPQDVWTQNIYWSWLYTIKSLFTETLDKTGYPNFMKDELWNKKNLQASLGSWTELKHDTLLYAKQSYAEMGAGAPDEEPPPVPKGYVEPNIAFFDRMIALSDMTYNGLNQFELLDSQFQGRNETFMESLKFLRSIAVKELQNEVISDEDFEKLRAQGSLLGYVAGPLGYEIQTEDGARSALIADVHTNVPDSEIMYEATGIPNYIYVAVKDTNGTRLTKGLVFSYFEFSKPFGERLNDQDWRELNYTQDKTGLPPAPVWVSDLVK